MRFQRKPSNQEMLEVEANQTEFIEMATFGQTPEQMPVKPKTEAELKKEKEQEKRKKKIIILASIGGFLLFALLFLLMMMVQRPGMEFIPTQQTPADRTRLQQQYLNEDITTLIQQLDQDLRTADPTVTELPFPQVRFGRTILQ